MIDTEVQEITATEFNLWNIEFAATWFLEFPKDELQKLLPSDLQVYESRPQVGLLCATVFVFKEGHPHCKPVSSELTLSVQVIPDFTLLNHTPRYALYVFSAATDTAEFLSHEYNTDKLPFTPDLFTFNIEPDNSRVHITDSHGQPVLDLNGPATKGPFSLQENYYQYFTSQNNALHAGCVKMENSLSIHQELNENFGQLFNHPIFRGLDVSKLEDCFLHLNSEDGNAGVEYFNPSRPINT